MDPDKYQQAWQAQSSQTRITIDASLLRQQVQRNQHDFRAMILRRDFLEVGVGLLMLPFWVYKGLTSTQPWTWWLTVPAIIWVIGFFPIDRIRHPQTPSDPGEPLLKCAQTSLAQVEHQIWLLRRVFWWYLLPFTVSILLFFAQASWQISGMFARTWWALAGGVGFFIYLAAFLCGVYGFIDYINQRAVRKQLEPRRQELLALLVSLGGDDAAEGRPVDSGTQSIPLATIVRRWLFIAILTITTYIVAVLVLTIGKSIPTYEGPPKTSGPVGESLGKVVTAERKDQNLVGLAAMIMVDGHIEAAAAEGERKAGSGVPLEIGDQWHLGGITKSITATMIARLVESGQMKWSDTVGQVFPEASVRPEWKPVTLIQLLTDTAGAPRNFPTDLWNQRPALGRESTDARRAAVLRVLTDKPAHAAGEKYEYSNVGYPIAAAMTEKVTGATWEDLVKREVFGPLKLTSAGFGPPKSSDESLEQPRGHRSAVTGKVAVDDTTDLTPIMGPAGNIHMTLADLCTFANDHLQGELGHGNLLSAETYKLLHTPGRKNYACGWLRNEPNENVPFTEFWHNGSNTYWYAVVAFIPDKNMVVAVTTNDGDSDQADVAAVEILKTAVQQFNVESDSPGSERK